MHERRVAKLYVPVSKQFDHRGQGCAQALLHVLQRGRGGLLAGFGLRALDRNSAFFQTLGQAADTLKPGFILVVERGRDARHVTHRPSPVESRGLTGNGDGAAQLQSCERLGQGKHQRRRLSQARLSSLAVQLRNYLAVDHYVRYHGIAHVHPGMDAGFASCGTSRTRNCWCL